MIKIIEANENDMAYVDEQLLAFNNHKVPFKQSEAFIDIDRCIKNDEGQVIAGISATLEMWNVLHINILWVADNRRGQGLGEMLVNEIERLAKKAGSKLAYLETFDFQAKEFYEKMGYSAFGQLEECVDDHTLFFMQKRFNE